MSSARTSREARWALNYAARRHGWGSRTNYDFEPGVVARYVGRAVTMARPRVPFAISTDGRGSGVLHETRSMFVAWYRGVPAGSLVVLWCGGSLVTAELTGDYTRGSRVCAMCPARRQAMAETPPLRRSRHTWAGH